MEVRWYFCPTIRPRVATTLLLLATVLVADGLLHLLNPPYPALGLLDEPAHLATAALVVLAIAPRHRVFAVSALVSAVVLDLDHLPQELGSDLLTRHTSRPVTHSLAGLALIVAAAGLSRRRAVVAGVACGIASHLLRDLATGGGVPLLWPLTDSELQIPYAIYVALLGALTLNFAFAISRGRSAAPR
jgi:inner membrane protein